MLFQSEPFALPAVILEAYQVTRTTVWTAVDMRHTLICVSDGLAEFEIGDSRYTAESNDILYVPAGIKYVRKPVENNAATFEYIHFQAAPAFTEANLKEPFQRFNDFTDYRSSDSAGFLLPEYTKSFAEAAALFHKILACTSTVRSNAGIFAAIYLQQLLLSLTARAGEALLQESDYGYERRNLHNSQYLDTALRYIRMHYSDSITLSALSEICGISEQRLIRLFKQETGSTPLQYINDYRLSHAQMIIRNNTELSISEVAYEAGFDNPNYFSRLFQKKTGRTPSGFRQHVLDMELGKPSE